MRMALSASLVALASAENGDHSLYGYAGSLGGFHWMSEMQPTTNDCTNIQPPFCQSEYCGPGHFRADPTNVEVTDKGFKLTAKAPKDPLHVTNAQLYLCASEQECASRDGTTNMTSAVANQKALGPGTFVFQVDSFAASRADGKYPGKFPRNIVLGLYLYKPNMTIQGNVDCHDELDIEYAGWGDKSTVGFTTWVSPQSKAGSCDARTETDSGIRSYKMVPGCAAIRWSAGTSVQYALWKPVNGTCNPEDCFGHSECGVTEHTHAVPINHMVPSINLWWSGSKNDVAIDQNISVTISDFQYIPESPGPHPAPTPVPTPAPTPTKPGFCCYWPVYPADCDSCEEKHPEDEESDCLPKDQNTWCESSYVV